MSAVEVITGARLHFGLLCGEPSAGWNFGGVGLMVDSPGWHIRVIPHENIVLDGTAQEAHERLREILPRMCQRVGLPGLRLEVRKPMPLHTGLGAGTQLTLAAVTAALVAAGQPRPADSKELADQFHRARRSGIGTRGFDRGGFLVDEGQTADSSERTIHRIPFPDAWRMVLVFPPAGQGLHGTEEEAVFDAELQMSAELMESQRRLINDDLCPALTAGDFVGFRSALFEYGQAVGQFFSGHQGGVYSNSKIAELCQLPEFEDCRPVQSSWGPTVAIPAESQAEAMELLRRIEASSFGSSMPCLITAARNQGALVRSVSPEDLDKIVRA